MLVSACTLGSNLNAHTKAEKLIPFRTIYWSTFKGQNPFLDSLPLKMGPSCCLKMIVKNYNYSLCNSPEESSSHLLRARSLYHAEKLRLSRGKIGSYIHLVQVKNVFHCSINGINVHRFVKTGFKVTAVNNLHHHTCYSLEIH
jgi:hypothetical protein